MYETINSPVKLGRVSVSKSLFGRTLYSKKGFSHYRKLVEIAHNQDCKICAQLFKSDLNFKGMIKYIPKLITIKISKDDFKKILNIRVGEFISSISAEGVKVITTSFGDAAVLAEKAGFDMVQVHGDRMGGSFSSAVYNHRKDRYGGSPEKRATFAVEAVEAVHKKASGLSIDYKLCVRQENPHYGNAGVLIEELPIFIPLLEKAGVTSFHVTLANHSELSDTIPPATHTYFQEEGCFLKYSHEVRKCTKLPICGVGGLSTPGFIEERLKNGPIDCVAMSRQLIADPDWVYKTTSNQGNKIKHCLRCNIKCLEGMRNHQGVHCIYDKEDN